MQAMAMTHSSEVWAMTLYGVAKVEMYTYSGETSGKTLFTTKA